MEDPENFQMCEPFKFFNARFFYPYWIVEKFSNSTCFHQIVSLNLQHKNPVFSVKPQADIVWQTFRILLLKDACAFGQHQMYCFMITFCFNLLVNGFETFQKHFLIVTSKNYLSNMCLCSGQTDKHCAWQAKFKMFAKQCLFDQSLTDMILNSLCNGEWWESAHFRKTQWNSVSQRETQCGKVRQCQTNLTNSVFDSVSRFATMFDAERQCLILRDDFWFCLLYVIVVSFLKNFFFF